jgi:DNA-binding MarR family transcriptional regulator
MDKLALLRFLNARTQVDGFELAQAFGESYPSAAMALLRASRQGLVERFQDAHTRVYWYRLSARGHARLVYLQEHD